VDLEATGIKTSERVDRMKYEREREANRERITRLRLRIPDGYTEDLEPVEASEAAESPGPTPKPVLEQSLDAVITDTSDPRHFRELASLLRTGRSLADEQRARREARRLRRKLDREAGGYERRKDGARMSPAAFLRSELRGVSGMGYPECSGAGRLWGASPKPSRGRYRLVRIASIGSLWTSTGLTFIAPPRWSSGKLLYTSPRSLS
jgi:hypothetical protein